MGLCNATPLELPTSQHALPLCGQGLRQGGVRMAYLRFAGVGAPAGEFKGWNHLKVCLLPYWQIQMIGQEIQLGMSAGTSPHGLSMQWDVLQIRWLDPKVEKKEGEPGRSL